MGVPHSILQRPSGLHRLSVPMPLISINGGSLFAERFGSGPPRVLAMHGWGRRGADFSASLGSLDALAVDLPGFGASPPPTVAMGARGYAELIGPALDMFDLPPVVVGHSFGGRVAVAREFLHPGSASGLVLAAAPLVRTSPGRRPSLTHRTLRRANRMGLVSAQMMERRKRRHGSADYRAATGIMRDVLVTAVNESYEEELKSLRVPVHLVWGSDDAEVPPRVGSEAARIIDGSPPAVKLDVLEGVGHQIPLQAAEALRRAVVQMLDRSRG